MSTDSLPMGKALTVKQLRQIPRIDKLVIHAIDLSLYQVSVHVDGTEHFILDHQGRYLRSYNIVSLQAVFEGMAIGKQVLRHQSCYDEMVGQPSREGSNVMEVPLGDNKLGSPQNLGDKLGQYRSNPPTVH
ncbi:DUF6482 family protein [Oceanobacter kriegii]|uniref:DUF6482 family protein n=1 Tax=Oceanobacter kriegii TaxID=64972 RepID=UPI000417A199|nr:DUF6482 family protein [Oceanobacter kriegii]